MQQDVVNVKNFTSPSFGKMNLTSVVENVFAFMKKDNKCRYNIIVGTDSQNHTDTDFISVVVVHRIGRGGRYFWRHTKEKRKAILRERIYREATLSLELAEDLIKLLKKAEMPQYNLEIHVDIGEGGPTREMINEVVGMIRGNGFQVKTKPDAYGASVIADRYT